MITDPDGRPVRIPTAAEAAEDAANHHGEPPPEPGDPGWCPSKEGLLLVPESMGFDEGPDDDAFMRELLAHMAKPIEGREPSGYWYSPPADDEDPGLLTADEREALALSGRLANLVGKIIRAGGGPTVDTDWSEAAQAIHVVQHMIGAQSAARAYPYEYRLLGSTIPPRPDAEPRSDVDKRACTPQPPTSSTSETDASTPGTSA